MDTTKNVNIRDLQQLNDAIAYTMDAIQRVSPQVQTGLSHSAFGPLPLAANYVNTQLAMDPFGVTRNGLEHAAYTTRSAFGAPFVSANPYAPAFGTTAGFAPAVEAITRDAYARGLLHSSLGATAAAYGNPFGNQVIGNSLANSLAQAYGAWGGVQYVPVRTW